MKINIFESKSAMGAEAAKVGAAALRKSVEQNGHASMIVATGASQFEMLEALAAEEDMPWNRITGFHLDEYAALPISHPASFRLYLWQRFISKLPIPVKVFHYLDGEGDCKAECDRVGAILAKHDIDVAFVGIGENGHLAFNDPPADFDTDDPYLVVELDEACRRQQLGEGWFPTLDDVPRKAISMSVRQIMKSRQVVCTVPDERKAEAVRNAVEGPVSVDVPASILQQHADCSLFLDVPAASLLKKSS